jgi:hypothetical protein
MHCLRYSWLRRRMKEEQRASIQLGAAGQRVSVINNDGE